MNKIVSIKTSLILILIFVIFACKHSNTKEKINFSKNEKEIRIAYFKEFYYLRVSEDLKMFSQEQLRKIENQYQITNKNHYSTEAIKALDSLINNKEYLGANRIGCALLNLGQISENDKKEMYLLEAKQKYSNCWYGDGVNVGAHATYKLYFYYKYIGKEVDAKKCKSEIFEKYSNYIDHNQQYLKDILATGN